MKNFPNAFVILLGVILCSWLFTYIVPQGSYERYLDEETGITRVINDSYHSVDAERPSFFDLLVSIPKGLEKGADLIVLIFLIGGCFYIIEKTGALSEGLAKLVTLLNGKESYALIILSILFTAGGVSIGMQEEVVALAPVLILFGKSLGYNTLTMLFASYGSTVVGSSFSPSNPFGVLIAQKEASLPLLSGGTFRMAVLLVAFLVWLFYLLRYAKKNRVEKISMNPTHQQMGIRHSAILWMLCLTFVIVILGILYLEWGFNEMSACFFALGIIAALLAKMNWNKTTETYIDGMKEMLFAALIMGLSNSISIILSDGMIMDTIVYGLFGPLKNFSPATSGILMMVSHSVLHFPVPSYSGQAVLTMPILVPLSDLIGLSRQTCVLAFQYGGVMADMIVPTNGALMAVLAIGNVPYNKWFKFAIIPTSFMLLIGAVAIIFAVYNGYQ